MTEPLSPSVGLAVLHLFVKPTPHTDAAAVAAAVKRAEGDGDQVVPVAMLGHKADAAFMVLGDDVVRQRRFQTDLQSAGLNVVDSYVSLTELSEYAQGLPPERNQARLHPELPPEGMRAWCSYPMTKRRNVGANWFTLPYDERTDLMYEHGTSGRQFAGRVVQVVTGSTGLDDFEWGVTLFANTPDDLKEVVYTMRFDEASALYGEFGTFYTGYVTSVDDLGPILTIG